MQSIEWYRFQWPRVTSAPYFKVTTFLEVEYLKDKVIIAQEKSIPNILWNGTVWWHWLTSIGLRVVRVCQHQLILYYRATLCGRSYCVRLSHLRVVSKRLKISGFSRPGGSHKILVFTQATLQNYCNGNTEWRPEIDVGTRQRENSHFTVNVLLCLGNRRFSHGISIWVTGTESVRVSYDDLEWPLRQDARNTIFSDRSVRYVRSNCHGKLCTEGRVWISPAPC